jgi:hypothetical protein
MNEKESCHRGWVINKKIVILTFIIGNMLISLMKNFSNRFSLANILQQKFPSWSKKNYYKTDGHFFVI